MLTKETKKRAEIMREELAPYFEQAKELANKLAKASKNTRQANAIANIWHYKGEDLRYTESLTDNQRTTESKMAKSFYQTDKKQWSKMLDFKWQELHKRETEEMTAKLNYFNCLEYIAKLVAYFLRNESQWVAFYDKKGLESLAEYLNENRTTERVAIVRDGGASFTPFESPDYYIYLNITIYGNGYTNGNDWGTFKRTIEEQWKPTRPIQKPVYTSSQVSQLVAKLQKQKQQAEEIRKENYNLAYSTGLCYFVEVMDTITAKKWKIR